MDDEDFEFPEHITVMNVVTYNVQDVIAQIVEDRESSVWIDGNNNTGGQPKTTEVTMEDVIERIQEYAKDDLSCGWGHEVRIKELVFQDERGNEY